MIIAIINQYQLKLPYDQHPVLPTRYFIYWVPNQYVDCIKEAILGKWNYF